MQTSQFFQWYPLAFSRDILPNKIYPCLLLNEPLIIFRNQNGQAVCLQDRCPHRSTPLSLGRLVDGVVECRYHGWRIDGGGRCIAIPSLAELPQFNNRTCVPAKVVMEQYGLIWVQMSHDSNDHGLSSHYHRHFAWEGEGNCQRFDFSIDLAIPHELMIENLLDPAHLPFAHHGTLSKRSKASPISFALQDSAATLSGIATTVTKLGHKQQTFHFDAPCSVYFDLQFKARALRQVHYCLPLSPSSMRLNSIFYYKNMPFMNWIPFIKTWQHKMSCKIVKQDLAMLVGQQRNIQLGAKPWNQAVAADKLAQAYRHWLTAELTRYLPWFNTMD